MKKILAIVTACLLVILGACSNSTGSSEAQETKKQHQVKQKSYFGTL